MKILFVVPYAPTPIRTRPYNLVRHLTRRGHSITLATLWQETAERAQLAKLESEGIEVLSTRLTKPRSAWNCLRALPTSTPLQAVYCWQPKLLERMNATEVRSPDAGGMKARWDIIHIEHLRGANYGLALRNSFIPHPSRDRTWVAFIPHPSSLIPPMVFDSVDCISYLFEQATHSSARPLNRLITRFELGRTRRYEARLLGRFDRVLVTSPLDKLALESLPSQSGGATHRAITILSNGVDLEHFVPPDSPRDPATIIFTGKMSYHANVTAAAHLAKDIMPLVWQKRPDVRLHIVGKDPTRQVMAMQDHSNGRVNVTGTVPDIVPYLQRAAVAIAPMPYGAGIQNKVLEAMACGTPVVASPQAVAALDARDGEELLVGDNAAAFARHILSLLDDPDLQRRIGQSGRRHVERCHDWNTIAAQLETLYAETIASRPVCSGACL